MDDADSPTIHLDACAHSQAVINFFEKERNFRMLRWRQNYVGSMIDTVRIFNRLRSGARREALRAMLNYYRGALFKLQGQLRFT
jgi:hypothetical protein